MKLPFFSRKKQIKPQEAIYTEAFSTLQNLIAPAGLEINTNYLKLGEQYCATLFVLTYPDYLASNWFSSIVNLDESFNISIFFHPLDINKVLRNLRKKSAEIQAQINIEAERGLVRNPLLEAALSNVEKLRDTIQQGSERLFDVGVYITFYSNSQEGLSKVESKIRNILEQQLIYAKPAVFREFEGLESTMPLGVNRLLLTTPLNSQPASTLFLFLL